MTAHSALLVAIALSVSACAAAGSAAIPLVRAHAETDLDCAGASIRIEDEWGGRYKAIGCGRKAYYRTACVGLTCEVRGEDEAPIPDQARPDPSDPIQPR